MWLKDKGKRVNPSQRDNLPPKGMGHAEPQSTEEGWHGSWRSWSEITKGKRNYLRGGNESLHQ